MSAPDSTLPLLVFEAADCLMAIVASEVTRIEKRGQGTGPLFLSCDLDEHFGRGEATGPWLQWARGTHTAWLRVRRVVDVMPVALGGLRPMPALLRAQSRTRAFLAVGLFGDDVFLLLDPARLVN